jgi:hypothetical protein
MNVYNRSRRDGQLSNRAMRRKQAAISRPKQTIILRRATAETIQYEKCSRGVTQTASPAFKDWLTRQLENPPDERLRPFLQNAWDEMEATGWKVPR